MQHIFTGEVGGSRCRIVADGYETNVVLEFKDVEGRPYWSHGLKEPNWGVILSAIVDGTLCTDEQRIHRIDAEIKAANQGIECVYDRVL